MNPLLPNSTVNKRVSFSFDQNKIPPNYRLLYQLHSTNSNGNDEEMWKTIANSYNFVTGAEYSWKELNTIWDRAPAMIKRKIGIESVGTDYVDSAKKPKKSSMSKKSSPPEMANQSSAIKPIVDAKVKLPSILKSNNAVASKQVLPNSTLGSSDIKSNASTIIDQVVNSKVVLTEDKNTQTDFPDAIDDLAQRDLKLNISIHELKLKFLQSHYRRRFGDFDK